MDEIKKKNFVFYIQITIIIVLVGILMYNLGQISVTEDYARIRIVPDSEVIPSGVPAIYWEWVLLVGFMTLIIMALIFLIIRLMKQIQKK